MIDQQIKTTLGFSVERSNVEDCLKRILAKFQPNRLLFGVRCHLNPHNGGSEIIATLNHSYRLTPPRTNQKTAKNFKLPKNREDSSDFDDFLTESIAAMRSIISPKFQAKWSHVSGVNGRSKFAIFRFLLFRFFGVLGGAKGRRRLKIGSTDRSRFPR